jgi:zinc transport system substrate-binding protein
MNSKIIFMVCSSMLLSCLICDSLFASNGKKIKVFVSITPQAYFVEKIGGESVDVEVLVGSGQSPATYEPTPQQMSHLAGCDVYFRIGVPFEKHLLKKLSGIMKDLNVINSVEGIEFRPMENDIDHGDHHHGATDPHVWMDPQLAKIIAENIFKEFKTIDPIHENIYLENLKKLQNDLDKLDKKITEILAPYKGNSFIVFHPILGYFADRYGLKQVAVETDGKEPGARQLVTLINMAKEEKVKTIFVQPQFSTKSAKRIVEAIDDDEAIDGKVEFIDPLLYDYINNMEDIARKLAEGFR